MYYYSLFHTPLFGVSSASTLYIILAGMLVLLQSLVLPRGGDVTVTETITILCIIIVRVK
jgi:hypothetical protein